MKFFKKTILVIIAVLSLAIVSLTAFQDEIIAHFSFVPEKLTSSPISHEKHVSDVYINTADNVKIHSLYFNNQNSKKAVLFFHGNAGNIYGRYKHAADLNKKGINVLLVEYRGYGLSEGEPTEPGLYRDAEAAYRYLLTEKGFKPSNIYILGRSIGSTVTMELSQNKNLGGIILISPLSTGKEMAELMGLGWLSWFAWSAFDNVGKAKNIQSPVLLIHGDKDEITPLRFGKNLYEALPENKHLITVKGADHNGMIEYVGPDFWTWVYAFIES